MTNIPRRPLTGLSQPVPDGHACGFLRPGRHFRCPAALGAVFAAFLMPLPVTALQSIAVCWAPSPSTEVAAYKLYYGTASGIYTNTITVDNVTSTTVSGLVEGNTYYFAATSITGGVESGFSNERVYEASAAAKLSVAALATQGVTTSIVITANGAVPEQWDLESSTDMQNWITIASGTNWDVNVSLPVQDLHSQFFRLKSE